MPQSHANTQQSTQSATRLARRFWKGLMVNQSVLQTAASAQVEGTDPAGACSPLPEWQCWHSSAGSVTHSPLPGPAGRGARDLSHGTLLQQTEGQHCRGKHCTQTGIMQQCSTALWLGHDTMPAPCSQTHKYHQEDALQAELVK